MLLEAISKASQKSRFSLVTPQPWIDPHDQNHRQWPGIFLNSNCYIIKSRSISQLGRERTVAYGSHINMLRTPEGALHTTTDTLYCRDALLHGANQRIDWDGSKCPFGIHQQRYTVMEWCHPQSFYQQAPPCCFCSQRLILKEWTESQPGLKQIDLSLV